MAGIKDRLIQYILRGKDELSPEAKKSAAALESVTDEAARLGQALDDAKGAQGLGKALERAARDVGIAQRNLSQAEQQVVDLRDALNKEPEAAGLQQSLKDAERAARAARRQLNALEAELEGTDKAARAAGIDTGNLSDEHQRLAAEVARAEQALATNNQQLKEAHRAYAAATRSAAEHTSRVDAVRSGMTSGAKQVLGFAAALFSLNAIFGVVQQGLNLVRDGIYAMLGTGDKYELLGKQMASLMGGVAQGEKATAWIKQFAKDTPLEVTEVTDAFALLKSYGLDPMGGSLQAIVDKNEQLGGGMERLQGISSALGQAYAKQKLQTEEILQLIERGVPAWALLEKVTGKNAAQLADLASKGRLGRDVIAALIEEMGRSAEGAAADNMSTLTGLVSNLSDVWSDFLNRIAKSGALDYAKQQLRDVADYIDRMDKDGRLDKLATSLSKAFEQGGEKLKKFADQLVNTDFDKLIDDSSVWLDNFGSRLESAAQSVQLFVAPFRTLVNGLTAGLSLAGAGLAQFVDFALARLEVLSKAVPASIGGDELRASIAEARGLMASLTDGFLEQVDQDAKDIAAAWDTTAKSAADSAKEQTEAVRRESSEQMLLGQAAADHFIASQKRTKEAAIDAAATGRQAIEGMAQALQLLDSASTVQQLEDLRGALLDAFSAGQLSQEEYAQATGVLNARLQELGGSASGAAAGVSDLEEKLGDLQSVQQAISSAKTDVDINNIRTALRKLYEGGEISAAQYNKALQETTSKQKELKGAVQQGTKAQQDKNKADEEAIVTSEQLRRESGKRMEAERQAGDAAMQARRKGSEEAKRDMSAVEGFFGGVLTRAREPLAGLSKAALDAYDKLRGIKSADLELDTSSLEATAKSLDKVNQQLDATKAALSNPLTSSLGKWAANMQRTSLETQKAYLGQKAALQSLMERYESGQMTLAGFANAAAAAKSRLGLLDDSDLSGLESAIKSAKEQMKQLGESTRGTLESLQDELDGLEGREADIQRRRFSARQRELQAQLAEAQASGDANAVSNAARALGVLRQIEAATEQQRVREEQKKRIEGEQRPGVEGAQVQMPSKVIRLEVSGRSVDVAVNDAADETKLLSLLEEAGLRSL
ncbi:tape measure protein [Aquipseudomonas alcaligenes]|uniref:Tape measure domain-containing protein n=1 Tax=Aquipseudomonas alcaligenes TaxID=43263 RepID=A0A1N6S7J4_AQUAC|nr:tape measure protein [Pseudomonas alcaligenes]SIQ37069.1 tape measure domain-containing protein [Pseudomonas alcaligenes]